MKHKITLKAVLNFIRAYLNKFKSFLSPTNWRQEQFEARYKSVELNSKECIEKGQCIHCGCETPDKFWEPAACEHGCYPEWMNKEQWLEFKKHK